MKAKKSERVNMGKRGTLVIAPRFRRAYGFEDGREVIQEPTPEGLLIRPAVAETVRRYTDKEKAEFILRAAMTRAEYREAVREVKALGLDPKVIPHRPRK